MTYNIDARAVRVLGRDTQSHRVIERPPLHTPSPLDALMESDESLELDVRTQFAVVLPLSMAFLVP